MGKWSFVYEGFEPGQESLREALCTLGNGYFATRGAAPEADADDVHYPATYLAGGYNRLTTDVEGRTVENEDLVNLPNWLPLTFRIEGGDWFDLRKVEILSYTQELDLKKGLLIRTVRFRDSEGRRTTLTSRRFVHIRSQHLAGIQTTLVPENWSGRLDVCSALDGRVANAGVKRYRRLNSKHLEPLETGTAGEDGVWLKARTNQSRIEIAMAARTRLLVDGQVVPADRNTIRDSDYVAQEFACDVTLGKTVTIEKIAALYTSRDRGISESGLEARKAIERAGAFDDLLQSHALAWQHLWEHFDIDVTNSGHTTLILRLHIFHLLQTVSVHTIDLDVGVPARGWHGEAYRGHIFWDELFIFPLLNFRLPELTRALLCYRHRRLPEARWAAREAGYRGAMYPWQGGSNGREESQKLHLNPQSGHWMPDNSYRQRHINAAIAYKIWEYYEVTADTEFLYYYGAEMLLEIARFWASIATYNTELGRYEILHVMGPDEYHDSYPDAVEPGVNNNAYTNIMAVWVLCRALEVLDMLPSRRRRELHETLHLEPEEIERWRDLSRKMRVVFHDDGIISQFEGYDRLQEFDWTAYRDKYGDIQRLDRILEAEGDTPNRYKVSKQADVLMLFYLFSVEELRDLFERLGYPFQPDTIRKNVDYYLQRTSHGSTLSRVVHSWVLARSDRPRSWRLFIEALESDIADIQGGTTPEGIHLGAMAGTVDLMQRGYTGIKARGDVLWFDPCLPDDASCLSLRLRYRQNWLDVEIDGDRLKVKTYDDSSEPIKVGFQENVYPLKPGETREFALQPTPAAPLLHSPPPPADTHTLAVGSERATSMNTGQRRLGILVGGGPAPGINSAISAATIEAVNRGFDVLGFYDGFEHLVHGRTDMVRPLTIADVSRIHTQGGSILHTSRANPTRRPEDLERAIQALHWLNVAHLITIGGDDTAFGAFELAKAAEGAVKVAHLPKTIDNDLPLPTAMPTFGFETARHVGTESALNLMEDCRTTNRWSYAVVMGRRAGHLALGIGKSAGATLTIIPEEFPTERITLADVCGILEGAILKRRLMGRKDGLAVIAEGVGEKLDPEELAKIPGVEVGYDPYGHITLGDIPLASILKHEVQRRFADRGERVQIVGVTLGYELRCAPPIPFDIDYTRTLGYGAVRFLLSQPADESLCHGGLLCLEEGYLHALPFEGLRDPATGRTRVRLVDLQSEHYKVARDYMIRLEARDLDDPDMRAKLAEAAAMKPEQLDSVFAVVKTNGQQIAA